MQNIESAGSEENVGSIPQLLQGTKPLPRLNPRQVAVLVLPGQQVTVMDASDKEFQAFVNRCDLNVEHGEIAGWSFDDRIRLINFARKYGVDLFAEPNGNNSQIEQNQFANNSETIPDGELFISPEAALQAIANTPDEELIESIGNVCDFVLASRKINSDHSSSSGE